MLAGGMLAGGTQAGGTQAGGTQAGGMQAGGALAGGMQAGGTPAVSLLAGGLLAGGMQAGGTQAGGAQAAATAPLSGPTTCPPRHQQFELDGANLVQRSELGMAVSATTAAAAAAATTAACATATATGGMLGGLEDLGALGALMLSQLRQQPSFHQAHGQAGQAGQAGQGQRPAPVQVQQPAAPDGGAGRSWSAAAVAAKAAMPPVPEEEAAWQPDAAAVTIDNNVEPTGRSALYVDAPFLDLISPALLRWALMELVFIALFTAGFVSLETDQHGCRTVAHSCSSWGGVVLYSQAYVIAAMGALYLSDFFLTFVAVSRQLAQVAYQPHRFAHILSHLVAQVRVHGVGAGLGAQGARARGPRPMCIKLLYGNLVGVTFIVSLVLTLLQVIILFALSLNVHFLSSVLITIYIIIIIIIIRCSGINPIPPTVKDRDWKETKAK